jgi:hypothetical protein
MPSMSRSNWCPLAFRPPKNKVVALKETVRARDEALLGTGQEIETLRVTVHDRDELFEQLRSRTTSCVIRSWAGRPMPRVSFRPTLISI